MPSHYLGTCAWPRSLPGLADLLDTLGNPSTASLAQLLGVDARTVRRWLADGQAPRAVLLVLYLCTPAALSERESRADQAARLHAGLYECATRDLRALQLVVERLAPLARAGAANEPVRPGLTA